MSLPSRKFICTRANKLALALSLDVDLIHIMADDLKNLVCDQTPYVKCLYMVKFLSGLIPIQ